MVNLSISQAMNAYQNAQRVAEKSVATGIIPSENAKDVTQDFWKVLDKNINQTIDTQYRGEAAGVASLSNKVSPTDLAVAINNAELTLRTITSIRDRVINAYQDIIKMPV